MIKLFNAVFLTPTTEFRKLSVLLAIHDSPKNSQHKIGQMTHLSSSMVNNYIKEFHKQGLITISGKSNRTQTYHLTETARKELISLLIAYSTEIIQLYGAAKLEVTERLNHLHSEGIKTIVLFGAAETAEVVYAALKDTPLTVKGVVDSDPAKQGTFFNGFIVQAPEDLRDINADAVVITSFARQEEIHECIRHILGEDIKVKKLSDL